MGRLQMSETKTMWLLYGKSESGDVYPCLGLWDARPSDEEASEALLGVDTEQVEVGDEGCICWPNGELFFSDRNGDRHITYVNWELEEVEVNS